MNHGNLSEIGHQINQITHLSNELQRLKKLNIKYKKQRKTTNEHPEN